MTHSPKALRRIEDGFRSRDGSELFRRAWIPTGADRPLVLVHGFGEHSGRYEGFARWFAHRGFSVHAFDQRGHGRTPGARGHVDRFDRLLDDVADFIDLVAAAHPAEPPVLVGHSMGGLVATAFVRERQPAVDRLVASAPGLTVAPDVVGVRLRMVRLLRRIWPTSRFSPEFDLQALSRDPDVVRAYMEDPLVHGTVTAAFAAGMFDAQDRTFRGPADVRVPMLILHGEDDALCSVAGSRAFFQGLPHDRVGGSAIETYPGLRHEIFNEPEREQVYADLLGWLERDRRDLQSDQAQVAGVRVGDSATEHAMARSTGLASALATGNAREHAARKEGR